MKKVAILGLGRMGMPMARNLLKSGFIVHGYDIVPETAEALANEGLIASDSIAEAVENAEVVITMVQTGHQVSELCLHHDGIFSHIHRDAIYIDCSSIDISTTQFLHDEAEKISLAMLDAPVSGGVAGAMAATLTFMVGGSQENFESAQPVFKAMGKKIVHAGPACHGQAAKICNNLILAVSMIGVCEGFTLAEKLGLDKKKFFEISSNSSGQCWSMTSYCPVPGILENVPANHHYQAGFMAKMMLKDLRLAQHAAEMVETPIVLGTVASELYELFVNQGNGEMDFSGIITFIAKKELK